MEKRNDGRLKLYVEDAGEQLNDVERQLLELESDVDAPDKDVLNDIFRCMHTIKGGGDFLGLTNITKLAHAAEDILEQLRSESRMLSKLDVERLLAAVDELKRLLADPEGSEDFDISALVLSLRDEDASQHTEPAKVDLNAGRNIKLGIPGTPDLFQVETDHLETWQQSEFNLFIVERTASDNEIERELLSGVEEVGYLVESDDKHILFRTVLSRTLTLKYLELSPSKLYGLRDQVGDLSESATFHPVGDQQLGKRSVHQPKPSESEIESVKKITNETANASSIRVNVSVLDDLMNLAGELVLTRNQLNQSVTNGDSQAINMAAQRLDTVTSELQESIMSTRMQPVSVVLDHFHRMTRDMSRKMGKHVRLVTKGEDVELDKSIIENIGDPLTHLVRNAIDHGIETVARRLEQGKDAEGTITIYARHEAGHVIIEVVDDGAGISSEKLTAKAIERGFIDQQTADQMSERDLLRLIFLPGFSTAEHLTDISGRGVGMDVVFTNLQRLGGSVDVDTVIGKGTKFRIKLPLTLTIVPSLLVSTQGESFAIPQVNLVELVRLSGDQKNRIEFVGDTAILRRRGQLLPIVWLHALFGMDTSAADAERRCDNIVVVASGDFHYGIAVEELTDSEEIVVKPLGAHLRSCREYAGATILGDGKAALILDVTGIADVAKLAEVTEAELEVADHVDRLLKKNGDEEKLLVLENAEDAYFAVQLAYVNRIERVPTSSLQLVGNKEVIKYRGGVLQVFRLEAGLNVSPIAETSSIFLIIFHMMGREVGLVVSNIIDVVDAASEVDRNTFLQTGVSGSTLINDRICLLLDTFALVKHLDPSLNADDPVQKNQNPASGLPATSARKTVLVVEDSVFFQDRLSELLQEMDSEVLLAEDGQAGWEMLDACKTPVDVVLMDVEMPRMNGLELTRRMRSDARFQTLPIVMLTSLAKESDIESGKAAGANDYLVKMDPEMVKQTVLKHFSAQSEARFVA